MSYRSIFNAKISSTNFYAVFDFAQSLAVGETISSQSVTAVVYSGTDASPSSIISGAATSSGSQVTQTITGGVVGVTYVLACVITTSASKTFVLDGYLTVKANGT
jgi:hypothetical protein